MAGRTTLAPPLLRGAAVGGLALSFSTRAVGALCALTIFTGTAVPAFAEEEPPRLRPTSRGSRYEEPRLERITSEPPAPVETPAPPPMPPPAPALGDQIAELALGYVGFPYVWGGASPLTGFDCSGFIQYVLGRVGVGMNRVAADQYQQGEPVAAGQLQPGDLVFFANTYTVGLSHAGIYLGDGRFVDAGTERTGVRVASLWDPYWGPRFVGARRVVG